MQLHKRPGRLLSDTVRMHTETTRRIILPKGLRMRAEELLNEIKLPFNRKEREVVLTVLFPDFIINVMKSYNIFDDPKRLLEEEVERLSIISQIANIAQILKRSNLVLGYFSFLSRPDFNIKLFLETMPFFAQGRKIELGSLPKSTLVRGEEILRLIRVKTNANLTRLANYLTEERFHDNFGEYSEFDKVNGYVMAGILRDELRQAQEVLERRYSGLYRNFLLESDAPPQFNFENMQALLDAQKYLKEYGLYVYLDENRYIKIVRFTRLFGFKGIIELFCNPAFSNNEGAGVVAVNETEALFKGTGQGISQAALQNIFDNIIDPTTNEYHLNRNGAMASVAFDSSQKEADRILAFDELERRYANRYGLTYSQIIEPFRVVYTSELKA